jgi:hypothetical protein
VRRGLSGALIAAAALALPAGARAGDVTTVGRCFSSGQPLTVSGSAFTAHAVVHITGDVTGTAQADAAGAFRTQVVAPTVTALGPRTATMVVVDQANPANRATMRIRVVREAYGSNLPIAGRPDELTTWRFAGFVPRRPIFGHFVLDGRLRGSHRFGVACGVCGTLRVRARRIPGVAGVRAGAWTLKLDQRRRYVPSGPGAATTFRIASAGG